MGTSKDGIVKGDCRLGAGVHRERSVVFLCQKRYVACLCNVGKTPGLVHHAQRQSAGAVPEALLHDTEHTLFFLRSQFPVLISAYAAAGGAMSYQYRHVAGTVAVDGIEERFHRRVDPGLIVSAVTEEAAAYLVQMRRICLKTNGGEAAVAGNEGGDSLADEGLEVFERLLFDGEPVVVRMGLFF